MVWPEVAAPKRRASVPSSSLTRTPGIARARFHKSLCTQFWSNLPNLPGLTNTTSAARCRRACVINCVNSPIEAREHGHFGCTIITSVDILLARGSRLVIGHCFGGVPAVPGASAWFHNVARPIAEAISQSGMTSAKMGRRFTTRTSGARAAPARAAIEGGDLLLGRRGGAAPGDLVQSDRGGDRNIQ